MTRILPRLAVALLTFTIGVSIAAIHRFYRVSYLIVPDLITVDQRSSCFPGRSVILPKPTTRAEIFPLSALGESAWNPSFLKRWYWYSAQLKAMNERPLSALENEDESYRFLWLRAFHKPVAIHVWRAGAQHFIVAKRLNGRSGYEPGRFDLYWSHSLSQDEWDEFMLHLEHAEYWLMPSEHHRTVVDGAQWVMEGYREGRYKVVDRNSPEPGAYRDACLYLLRQSGLLAEIPANEIY